MFTTTTTISLFVVALVIAAGASPVDPKPRLIFPNGRIVGGHDTDIKSHPYQISLQVYNSHSCGGSIISENFVLTAGHCVGSPAKALSVRAGSSLRGKEGSVHEVEEITRHKNYSTNRYGVPLNDIALLKLKTPIKLDDTSKPVVLFKTDEEATPGLMSNISGWGSTGKGTPTQLQTVTIPIVSKDLCNEAYKSYGGIPEGQICAAYYGVGGKDSCQGDSGGPLTIDGRLAGVVSWGNGCAKAEYPGVYTEVAYFRKWIEENSGV